MPRFTRAVGADIGVGDRWDASRDIEAELRRARRAHLEEIDEVFAGEDVQDGPPVGDPFGAPAGDDDLEGTEVAGGDIGNLSSLGEHDEGSGNGGSNDEDAASPPGGDVNGPLNDPASDRSGRGKGKPPPPKRHRKVLR